MAGAGEGGGRGGGGGERLGGGSKYGEGEVMRGVETRGCGRFLCRACREGVVVVVVAVAPVVLENHVRLGNRKIGYIF